LKKVITTVIILIAVLGLLINLFEEQEITGEDYTETLTSCVEESTVDSVSTARHWRTWEEYGWNEIYCADYEVDLPSAEAAGQVRQEIVVNETLGPYELWRDVYYDLYVDARVKLTRIQDSLVAAGQEKELDREAFARMVVAFVQDIPYQFVLSDGCEGKGGLCNPYVKWGIYSPLEFLYSLRGDCDTRTVLLFTLLKNFGYSPVIINSVEYKHSMLALDLPSSGDDFLYKGRRYAYWETTNVGWLPGMLPPEMNNKNYWQVVLDYEYQDKPARIN